ncbi:nucleotidyltransferase domain-containing protein [Microbispora sp. NPDC049633]|uniref:nucleotidyltransferase domain-containing protein n=1 Tax=Microbispora sp. NPDC049633 TaxID=3154355 RepID=UPI003436C577
MSMTDQAFLDHVADRLTALPGVRAVTLGGSRAQGTHAPGSDWDFAVYYRGPFDPAAMQTAHAVLAARGGWVTNEKCLLERAGLRDVDAIVAALRPDPRELLRALAEAEALFAAAV